MQTKLDTTVLVAAITANYDINAESLAALQTLGDGDAIPGLTDNEGDEVEIEWRNISENSWTDDVDQNVHQFGRVFVHDDGYNVSAFEADSIEGFLGSWDSDSYGSNEELLVAFGLEPGLDEADEDYEGACKIWVRHHYYSGTCNAPRDGWVKDEDGDGYPSETSARVFKSVADAREWIETTEDCNRGYKSDTDPRGCYLLSHGEYAAPDFVICKA